MQMIEEGTEDYVRRFIRNWLEIIIRIPEDVGDEERTPAGEEDDDDDD